MEKKIGIKNGSMVYDLSDGSCKSSSMRSKLQLKKNNIQSDDKNAENKTTTINDNCQASGMASPSLNNKDDTLSDFKSPPRVNVSSAKMPTFKLTTVKEKGKFKTKSKLITQRNKERNNKQLVPSKKENVNNSQQLIESSFFKTKCSTENKEGEHPVAYLCPICFKSTKNENVHSAHMKVCANKNNISTKKLLDAVELQERQAEERKSLGLLARPLLPERKKAVVYKTRSPEDADFELALALSKSLHEAEELNEENALSVFNEMPEVLNEERNKKTTLQKFGFANNRPTTENVKIKSKKKRLLGLTVLQTRTADERNSILIERIAEVLVGNDMLTQKQVLGCEEWQQKTISLRSRILQEYYQTEDRLWDKASLILSGTNFYVPELSEFIRPSENQSLELCMEENIFKGTSKSRNSQSTIESPLEKGQERVIETSPITTRDCVHEQFNSTLIRDWGKALNNSSASDLLIFVSDNKHIWVHRLVFYVRCPNILLDIVPNSDPKFYSIKEKICWSDITFQAALAFLEFLYCGVIKTHHVLFCNSMTLSNIRYLARKYKVIELFEYLRKVENERTPNRTISQSEKVRIDKVVDRDEVRSYEILEDAPQSVNAGDELKTNFTEAHTTISPNLISNVHTVPTTLENTKTIAEGSLSQNMHVQERIVSPDMFDVRSNQVDVSNPVLRISQDKSSDLNMLLSLVNEDLQNNTKGPNPSTSLQEFSFSLVKENGGRSENRKRCLSQTPQFGNSERGRLSTIAKQKSDISIFIEKVRRQNAKSDSDIDSEVESPVNVHSALHTNPFKIHQRNDSGSFLMKNKRTTVKVSGLLSEPSALSMLENDVQSTCKNLAESLENSREIIMDDGNDLDIKFAKGGDDLKNNPLSLSQNNIDNERDSTSSPSTSSGSLKQHNSFNKYERTEASAIGALSQKRSPKTTCIRRDSSLHWAPSQRAGNVTNSSRFLKTLSQSLPEESVEGKEAGISMSTSFDVDDSVFNDTKSEKEDQNVLNKTCNSPKHKMSPCSPSLRSSQRSLNASFDKSDERKDSTREDVHEVSICDEDGNVEDVSMYTKYKREHLHNSIADYRAALKRRFDKQWEQRGRWESVESDELTVNKEHYETSPENVEDTDNLSTSSTLLLKEDVGANFMSENIDDSRSSFAEELFIHSREDIEKRRMSANPHIHDAETDVENENEDSIGDDQSWSQKLTDTSHLLKKHEVNTRRFRRSMSTNEETFGQQDAPEKHSPDKRHTNDSRKSDDNVVNDTNNSRLERLSDRSPIIISSSPEDLDVAFISCKEVTTNDSIGKCNLGLSENSDDEIDSIFLQDLNLANVRHNRVKDSESLSSSINRLQAFPILNSISNVTARKRRTERENSTDRCDVSASAKRNKSFDSGKRDNDDVSPKFDESLGQRLKRTRQLKTKSVSEGNISTNKSFTEIQNIHTFGSSQSRRPSEKHKDTANGKGKGVYQMNSQPQRTSREDKGTAFNEDFCHTYRNHFPREEVIITDKEVTPPPDYDNMSTPQLDKEMYRYGLKRQKRSRAVKLLTYIYNETHPLVPVSDKVCKKRVATPSSDDGGPAAKKSSQLNIDEDTGCDMLSQMSVTSDGYVDPAEIEFDEPESGPSSIDNPKSVVEGFTKLLKADRKLHNKILMYEPVNLMEVHAALKTNGYKCNVNALMDYLDEQCITFCVPENSAKSRTRKK